MKRYPIRSLGLALLLASCASTNKGWTPEIELRLETFERYWKALDERYPYFGRLDLDWREQRERYRPSVVVRESRVDFYHLLAGLLSELDDAHVSLQVPEESWSVNGETTTSLHDYGAEFLHLDLGQRHFILSWPEGQEPLVPSWLEGPEAELPELVGIEGYRYQRSLRSVLFRGRAGSSVDLELRWADGTHSRHVMYRPEARGPAEDVPASGSDTATDEDQEDPFAGLLRPAPLELDSPPRLVAVLHMDSFGLDGFPHITLADYLERLDEYLERSATADGLVLNLISNPGGALNLIREIATRFIQEPVRVANDEEPERKFSYSLWLPHEPVYRLPLVVLVGPDTGSAAEHLAITLQRYAGALVVGQPSLGIEAGLEKVEGPDGSRLVFGSIGLRSAPGRSFQGRGVVPDIPVRIDIDTIRQIGFEEALELYNEHINAGIQLALERLSGEEADEP